MKIEIKIPPLGESISEVTISTLLKPNGSVVRADEEILELETDKVNQPLYAPAAGTLFLTVELHQTIKVGEVIGFVETAAAPASQLEAPSQVSSQPAPKKQEISSLTATEQPQGQRKRMSSLRKTIAQRLVDVKNKTAMLTTFNEVDMSAIIALRTQEKERFEKQHGVRLGFMSFFIQAVVSALKAVPQVGTYLEGDEIVSFDTYDISVAVSTDKGLMVPVLRHCDTLSYAEVEKQLALYAQKARDGSISIEDLKGGCFTITNGGVFGSLLSTPILNPPQSAILGMHAIVKRPMVIDDQIVVRPMMYLALSYDHRIIDGKEAVIFLVKLKEFLESPPPV